MATGSARALRALVISHEEASRAGGVGERLTERGVIVDVHVVVPDSTRPDLPSPFPDIGGYDVVVPMGSYWSVYDHDTVGAWIDDELALLRQAHESGTPVLGVCFGGQALAAALGGCVQLAEVTEIGWYELTAVGDAELPFGTGPWMEWHHDCFTVPPDAVLLARTENAAQLFRSGRSVGTQFHPEIDVDLATEWLAAATDDYLAAHGVTRDEILAGVAEHDTRNRVQCAALVDWFLDDVAGLAP